MYVCMYVCMYVYEVALQINAMEDACTGTDGLG